MQPSTLQFQRGAHDCHLYQSWSERRDVALPFIREGLANHEHCILVTSADSFDTWRRDMDAFGIDADAEEHKRRLQLIAGDAFRTPLATAGSLPMARNTLAMLKPLFQVFNGVRIVGDAEWSLAPSVAPRAVCHWEATGNIVYEDSDVHVICQYSVKDSPVAMLHGALLTHPSVIWNGRRRRNRHYEAPLILQQEPDLDEPTHDRGLVEAMLSDLDRA